MQRFLALLLIGIPTVFSLSGCVAPGSSIGRVSVAGELVAADGAPIANESIEIVLPAAYGLGGVDRYFGDAENYGHKTETFRLATGPDGTFEALLGERVYHISYWLLPPIGGFPRRPPPPFIILQLPDRGSESYAIQTWNGEYKAFDSNGTELSLDETAIVQLQSEIIEWDSEQAAGTRADLLLVIKDEK